MTLYLAYDDRKLLVSGAATTPLGTGDLHENDFGTFSLVILRSTGNEGSPYTVGPLPDGLDTIALGGRDAANIPAGMILSATGFTEAGSGDTLHYEAVLDLTGAPIHDLFPDADLTRTTHAILVDIQFSASDDSRRETPVRDWPFVISRDIYDADEAAPVHALRTTVEYLRHDLTGLTGGGPDKLDGVATVAVATNLTYGLFIAPAGRQTWRLEASDATPEDGVTVVDPDDFDLSTNNRKWYRRA